MCRCNKPPYSLANVPRITLLFGLFSISHLLSVRNDSSCMPQCCFCVWDHLVTKRSLSLCSIVRRCHRLVWPSWLHCPRVSPTKGLAWTLLVATSAPQRCCHSAGLIPFPGNYWATWRREEVQTLSAPSCSGSQEQVLLTTLPGRRPRYDQEQRLSTWGNGLKHTAYPTVVCFSRISKHIHHVHFLGFTWMDNPLDSSLSHLIYFGFIMWV